MAAIITAKFLFFDATVSTLIVSSLFLGKMMRDPIPEAKIEMSGPSVHLYNDWRCNKLAGLHFEYPATPKLKICEGSIIQQR